MAGLDENIRRELGELLRGLRQREGLTLAALSIEVGVSQSALSQFETGKTEPSLGTLWKLGRALNASLFDFFAREPAEVVEVTRAAARTAVTFDRCRYEAVARSGRRKLDFFFLHLDPGDGPVRDPAAHAGEECGVVLEGELEVTVGNSSHRLGPGDGIWFVSEAAHTFSVVGDHRCVSVWADTLPDRTSRGTIVESLFGARADPTEIVSSA